MTEPIGLEEPGRAPSAGRIGALAAVTPIVMFGAWGLLAGWGGTPAELVRGLGLIGFGAALAGWILGGRLRVSMTGSLIAIVAYGPLGYVLLLPLNVLGATLEDIQPGRSSDAFELVASAGAYLLYGLFSAIYVGLYLLPFGFGWVVTFFILRWVFAR